MAMRISLLLLRWKIKMGWLFRAMRHFQMPHEKIHKIFLSEALSFGCLFGIAMGLLNYDRFQASTILFSVAVFVLAFQLLLRVFSDHLVWRKSVLILSIFVAALYGTRYLTGVCKQAENNYYFSKMASDAAESKRIIDEWKSERPAFAYLWPLGFDRAKRTQDFAVLPSWKPLTVVEITLIDNSQALALGKDARRAMTHWSFAEVSSNYLIRSVSWVKPLPYDAHLEDFYLIIISSHEGGNYKEELNIFHKNKGIESFHMEITDKKEKVVFTCFYSPPTNGSAFKCSGH